MEADPVSVRKHSKIPAWLIAVGLGVLLLLLCYGLFIPWLGFYWDDLAYLLSLNVFGPSGFTDFVAVDRPFSRWMYILQATLFGNHALAYQMFSLSLRGLAALALFALLDSVWPRQGLRNLWAPLAFLVYPALLQQPISFIYTLFWLNLAQELASLTCMVKALRSQGRARLAWTAASILLMFNLFSLEYMFGLEALRPLLIWIIIQPIGSFLRRLRQVIRQWLPYLPVILLFLAWNLVLFRSQIYSIAGFSSNLPERMALALRDLAQFGLLPWLEIFSALAEPAASGVTGLLSWLVTLAAGLLTGLLLWLHSRSQADTSGPTRAAWLAACGFSVLVFAGIPFWGVGLDPEPRFPYDRFGIPFSIGSCLLLAAFLEGLIVSQRARIVLFAVLIGLSAGSQFRNTNSYRREWSNVARFANQLTRRIPALAPGTLLLTHDLPFQYYSDYSLSSALNMIYTPGLRSGQLPNYLMYIHDRLGGSLPSLEAGTPVTKIMRSFTFQGNTAQALVLTYSPPGCLRVLDPARPHELPELPAVYGDVLPLSRLDRIGTAPPAPAAAPDWFADEPVDPWCEAYLAADLARQRSDWAGIMALWQQVQAQDVRPAQPSEWGVFAEAAARSGDEPALAQILEAASAMQPDGGKFACAEWGYLHREGLVGSIPAGCPALGSE